MAAGEAPPPPPATWGGDYGGKTGESQGIVAIMEMVHEDIVKDRADAKADEDSSQSEFDDFKADSESKMKALNAEKEQTEKDMGAAETKKDRQRSSVELRRINWMPFLARSRTSTPTASTMKSTTQCVPRTARSRLMVSTRRRRFLRVVCSTKAP